MSSGAPVAIDLPQFTDPARGSLSVAENPAQVPFPIRRTFFLYDLPVGGHRGGHAHLECEQFLICVAGSLSLRVCWPGGERIFALSSPQSGIYLPPLCWVEITVEAAGTVCLVLASHPYDPADYVHDRREFDGICTARADLGAIDQ